MEQKTTKSRKGHGIKPTTYLNLLTPSPFPFLAKMARESSLSRARYQKHEFLGLGQYAPQLPPLQGGCSHFAKKMKEFR